MRRVVISVILTIAGVASACSDTSQLTVTASATTPATASAATPPATSIAAAPPSTNGLDAIRTQITRATKEICTLISAQNVAVSFAETVPLTTQPMGEASGPACGYPHPRAGGYLLVIQFQDLARWGGYAKSGTRVEGLGADAALSSNRTQLYVRDLERDRVIMLLAPDTPVGGVDALLHVAAAIYGKPPETIRVAG